MTSTVSQTPPPGVYDLPRYYEIAFSYRNYAQEVAVMEDAIREYSRLPVHNVLEVACGPCSHLPEWLARGYSFRGLDLNPHMLAYAADKAAKCGGDASFIEDDMRQFASTPVDFAYVLLGSMYVDSTDALRAHYASMAHVIKPGGLYFLEWCVDFNAFGETANTWEESADGIALRSTLITRFVDSPGQLLEEWITLDVNDNGRNFTCENRAIKRIVFPQEFLLFIEHTEFEFIGWWNNWNLDEPLASATFIDRPIIILRRK